jgi:hypothetical protein
MIQNYFVTIFCQDKVCLFDEIENGEMRLNIFGEIAGREWQETTKIKTNTKLHEFIIQNESAYENISNYILNNSSK